MANPYSPKGATIESREGGSVSLSYNPEVLEVWVRPDGALGMDRAVDAVRNREPILAEGVTAIPFSVEIMRTTGVVIIKAHAA